MKNACSLGTFRGRASRRALVSPVIAGALLAAPLLSGALPVGTLCPDPLCGAALHGGAQFVASASDRARADTGKDPVFRAMQEEIDRSMRHLVLPGMPAPYFMAYWVQDNETLTIEARYGALVDTSRARERYLCSQVRVGSPEMDNTGFVGGWDDLYSMRERLSEEDDLIGLRRQLWLHTDVAYKNALESLARKQAYLQAHPARDTVPDFGPSDRLDLVQEPVRLNVDAERWTKEIRAAGKVLAAYPALQDWRVRYYAVAVNKRHLNSEGRRHHKGAVYHYLDVSATAQAPDGQRLSDCLKFTSRDEEPLAGEHLADEIRALAEELTAMAAAPLLDEYAGPVLFTDYAAAQVLSQLFVAQLAPVREPLYADEHIASQAPSAKLPARLQRRVMPDFVTITDQPARDEWNGIRLAGRQQVDDEGTPAGELTLVRAGRLVDLPMSRLPSKKLRRSNGHAVLLPNQWTISGITNLFVASDRPVEDLVAELRRLCQESGNEYGMLITRLADRQTSAEYSWTESFGPGDDDELLSAPIGVYKVYAFDGRREPVRGLAFEEISIRTLRDIAALGAQAAVINLRQPSPLPGYAYPVTIVTPAMLVEEMELSSAELAREPLPVSERPAGKQASARAPTACAYR